MTRGDYDRDYCAGPEHEMEERDIWDLADEKFDEWKSELPLNPKP
jgi:hypothetical protein